MIYTYIPSDIDNIILNPPTCSYSPAGHVITGDVNIVENEDLRSLIFKGHKFIEPRSFNWRQNFISIMNSVEDYARRWVKHEKEEQNGLKV